jgi:Ni,Fe-hydrogenase I small subunit
MLPSDVKMALLNYHEFKKSVQTDKDRITEINAKRFKAGASVIKIPECPKDRSTVIIENLMSLDLANLNLSLHTYLVFLADDFISSLNEPYKQLIIDWYINKKNHEVLAYDLGYSIKQTYNIIQKLIERYVEQR